MSKPLIITCAITGAEVTKEKQPNLPITPQEQATEVKKSVKAGASIIHLHVREEDGSPSQRLERFEEAITAIRIKVPEVIIQISTGGAIGDSMADRMQPLDLRPDMATLNMGTMNFGDEVFYNEPKDIVTLAQRIDELGVVPEMEIYDVGMLEYSFQLINEGVIKPPFHYQFVLGVPGGMSGDERNLTHLKTLLESELGSETHWAVAGIGRYEFPLAEKAIGLGGNVRVGFEDNIYLEKGKLATSNADLVEKVASMAKVSGRRVMDSNEVREKFHI